MFPSSIPEIRVVGTVCTGSFLDHKNRSTKCMTPMPGDWGSLMTQKTGYTATKGNQAEGLAISLMIRSIFRDHHQNAR
jgi:hypothetical protein